MLAPELQIIHNPKEIIVGVHGKPLRLCVGLNRIYKLNQKTYLQSK